MIHYHGTRIAVSDDQVARILKSKHAFVSYADTSQLSIVKEVCQSWALDNGAFSFWKSGKQINFDDYFKFIEEVSGPSMDFFIIPDVIGGTEEENDDLISQSPYQVNGVGGVPVWHTDESLNRLNRLLESFSKIAIGSGNGLTPNSPDWWMRIYQAMDLLTDNQGKPLTKIHGLRMLNPEIFQKLPFESADSTMVGRNINAQRNEWKGSYSPLSHYGKAQVLIDRIEFFNSPQFWERVPIQMEFYQ
jgi:hypothetical protein